MANCEEIIPKLPKVENFHRAYDLYEYQGVWLPARFLETTLMLQDEFQARASDIFLCSFMKTGSTWLKALAFAIMTRDVFDETTTPLTTSVPHECLPLMEIDFAKGSFSQARKLPLLATHNPYHLLPKSVLESGSKIVYICREPKDTFTSLWHMIDHVQHSLSSNDRKPFSLEEQFERFCAGKVAYGPYWEHALGYWKASIERPEKILFLKYEDVKRDSLFYVKELAEFMGKQFSAEEVMNGVPEKIVGLCSFGSLSNLEVNKAGKYKAAGVENKVFFRKGEIGDWKSLLTENMGKKMDMITDQKLQNAGFTFA